MTMKFLTDKLPFSLFALAIFSAMPAFATGNLTVTNGTLSDFSSQGDFWNTGMNVVLNISLNATVGDVNVTAIFINMTGTTNASNITGIYVYNDSNKNAIIDPAEALLGSNTTLNETFRNASLVYFTSNMSVPKDTKANIVVAYNISRSAFRFNTTGARINTNASIITNNLDSLDNVTVSTPIISTIKQILDMHANATLTPRTLDTNVSQQKIVYTITPSSQDSLRKVKIIVPTGYSLVDITNVSIGGTGRNISFDGQTGLGDSSNGVGATIGATEFNISFNTSATQGWVSSAIMINFTVNTNLSAQSSAAFTSKIFSNISFIEPEVQNQETNVTTTQIITITSVGGNKTAALTNGTDYWEFTFNVNFTANVSGLMQFRMSNWSSSAGTIVLRNDTTSWNNTQYYANMRLSNESFSAGRSQNVTDNYNITNGISLTTDTTSPKSFILRMTIPTGTPMSTGWWNVYSMLFRSTP